MHIPAEPFIRFAVLVIKRVRIKSKGDLLLMVQTKTGQEKDKFTLPHAKLEKDQPADQVADRIATRMIGLNFSPDYKKEIIRTPTTNNQTLEYVLFLGETRGYGSIGEGIVRHEWIENIYEIKTALNPKVKARVAEFANHQQPNPVELKPRLYIKVPK